MHYIIWFDVSAVIISTIGILMLAVQGRWKDTPGRFLTAFIFSGLLAELTDILSALILNGTIVPPDPVYTALVTNLYLLIHTLSAVLLFCYFVYRLRISSFITDRRWLLYSVPFVGIVLLVATNPWTDFVYELGENGAYRHHLGILVLYAFAFFYLISSAVQVRKFRDSFSHTAARVLDFFLIITLLSILWQVLQPELLIELFIQSIASVGIILLSYAEVYGYLDIGKSYTRRSFIKQAASAVTVNGKIRILLLKLPDTQYYNAVLGYENMHQMRRNVTTWLNNSFGNSEDRFFSCGNGNYARIFYEWEDADAIAEKIKERFRSSWIVRQNNDTEISITVPAEICVIRVPEDAQNVDQILKIVDARYDEKYGMTEIVKPSQVYQLQHLYDIQRDVEEALRNKRYEVYYQPIWNTSEHSADHAEALIRIVREDGSLMMPEEFIPVAENSGIIRELGFRVFEEVCRFISTGEPERHGIRMISVNVSAIQCMDLNLAEHFQEILTRYNVSAGMLNLEITETAVFNNLNQMRHVLKSLKDLGFSLTMDDYGTGYSNFTYILELPFTMVKLDKSILGTGAGKEFADIILEQMITMLRKMNFATVTEGVETQEQKEHLETLGALYLQGFYFSRPLPEKEFLKRVDLLSAEHEEKQENRPR